MLFPKGNFEYSKIALLCIVFSINAYKNKQESHVYHSNRCVFYKYNDDGQHRDEETIPLVIDSGECIKPNVNHCSCCHHCCRRNHKDVDSSLSSSFFKLCSLGALGYVGYKHQDSMKIVVLSAACFVALSTINNFYKSFYDSCNPLSYF